MESFKIYIVFIIYGSGLYILIRNNDMFILSVCLDKNGFLF